MNRYQFNSPYQRLQFFPPVIKWLLALNIIIFVLDKFILPGVMGTITVYGEPYTPLTYYGALWPVGSEHFMPWQYLTTMFLHGDGWHILLNMFVLWMFGLEIANLWGTKRFLVFYILSGLGASLLHTAIGAMQGNLAPAVGASGAIAGVVIAFSVLFPDRLILLFFFFPMKARWAALLYVGYELYQGVLQPNDGIAHFAHLGGVITGFLLLKTGLLTKITDMLPGSKAQGSASYSPPPRPATFSRADQRQSAKIIDARFRDIPEPAPRDHPVSMDFGEDQERIDGILDKISQHGYQSLTDEERALLVEASKSMRNGGEEKEVRRER